MRLADDDNENDEYHASVPLVDMWLSYKALADDGWTQQRIADAKGVKDRSLVSDRLRYAALSNGVKKRFVENPQLREGHAAELVRIVENPQLAPWLSHETAMIEVINTVLRRTTTPTAKQFAEEVARYNELHWTDKDKQIARRKAIYEELHPDAKHGATGRGGKKDPTVGSFIEDTAEKTSKSRTSIADSVQRANTFDDNELQVLRAADVPQTEAEDSTGFCNTRAETNERG